MDEKLSAYFCSQLSNIRNYFYLITYSDQAGCSSPPSTSERRRYKGRSGKETPVRRELHAHRDWNWAMRSGIRRVYDHATTAASMLLLAPYLRMTACRSGSVSTGRLSVTPALPWQRKSIGKVGAAVFAASMGAE